MARLKTNATGFRCIYQATTLNPRFFFKFTWEGTQHTGDTHKTPNSAYEAYKRRLIEVIKESFQ